MTTVRIAALLACVVAWLWAWSIYTPWAADRLPRLWLYDALYYMRVLLVAWTLAECANWFWHPSKRRRMASMLLAATLLAGIAGWVYASTGIGWRWRISASADALTAIAANGNSDTRQRIGHVLVDTVRNPCKRGTPWFWLGRPHGGGSGINLAIIQSETQPQAPFADAFHIRHVGDNWWMAYQDGGRYHALQARRDQAACGTAQTVASHRAGMAFIGEG